MLVIAVVEPISIPSSATLLPGYSPTASVNSAHIDRVLPVVGRNILTPAITAAATSTTASTAATPRGERNRVPIAAIAVISTVPHDVRQAQVLPGDQPVALVEHHPVAAEHRDDDVEGLGQAVESHAPTLGVGA